MLGVTNASNPVGGTEFEMPCAGNVSAFPELPVFIPFSSHCQDMGLCAREDGCGVDGMPWAQNIIYARIAGYLGADAGGGGAAPSPSAAPTPSGKGPGPTTGGQGLSGGVVVAAAFASLAVGVSLGLFVPKAVKFFRNRREDREWGGGTGDHSLNYHGFGIDGGDDI